MFRKGKSMMDLTEYPLGNYFLKDDTVFTKIIKH